jgi:peroxiredoxin
MGMPAFFKMIFALALAVGGAIAAPVSATEITNGAKVPTGFKALDSAGRQRSWASIAGKNGTVIVLFRSAKWCPFCQAQLKSLKDVQAPLAHRGYSLAALSYDAPGVLAGFAAKTGIGYTLLSDEKSAMIDAFGLRDTAYAAGSYAYGVPKASILLVDAKGVIRWKSVASDYKIRPDNATILRAVDALR